MQRFTHSPFRDGLFGLLCKFEILQKTQKSQYIIKNNIFLNFTSISGKADLKVVGPCFSESGDIPRHSQIQLAGKRPLGFRDTKPGPIATYTWSDQDYQVENPERVPPSTVCIFSRVLFLYFTFQNCMLFPSQENVTEQTALRGETGLAYLDEAAVYLPGSERLNPWRSLTCPVTISGPDPQKIGCKTATKPPLSVGACCWDKTNQPDGEPQLLYRNHDMTNFGRIPDRDGPTRQNLDSGLWTRPTNRVFPSRARSPSMETSWRGRQTGITPIPRETSWTTRRRNTTVSRCWPEQTAECSPINWLFD